MNNFTALMLMCLIITANAQDTISFKDEFIDNSNNWSLAEDATQSKKIIDGAFVYQNKGTNAGWAHKNIFLDPTKDFSIESTITQTSGEENSGFGLVIGLDNGDNYYIFNIASTKYFLINEYRNKTYTPLKAWTASDYINPINNPNKLTIKKALDNLIFYINDNEVYRTDYNVLRGSYYGFYLDKNKTIAVENIIIKQDISPEINLVKNLKTGLKTENLGPNVNSIYDDKFPVISPDGKTLFISRESDPMNMGTEKKADIWISQQINDSTWGPAVNAGFPLNNNGSNFLISITPDNNSVLLGNTYNSDGSSKSAGYSIAYKTETAWTIPKDVVIKNYKNKHPYTSSCLSSSRKIMLLGAECEKTYGASDIYVSFLNDDGTWSEPKNIGPVVNTFGNEYTPFIAADDITMYYSTNGKRGYGDNDIFMTRRLDSTWTNWSEPENLGPEINTSSWDAYFSIPASGKYAYKASTKNSMGKLDIFKIKLPEEVKPKPVVLIYGKVLNSKTKMPIGSELHYYSLQNGREVGVANSNPLDGTYKIILPAEEVYSFLASKKDFVSVSDNIDLTELKEYKEIERNLYLAPIEVGQTIRLNNIFFEFGKANLLPTSFADLDRLVKLMNEYPEMQIEVAGHTDNVGGIEANLKLSQARALSVMNYLIEKNLPKTRLISKGYGESKPIDSNDSETARSFNRRVEFTILKK